MDNAYEELMAFLRTGEEVEAIVFGEYGDSEWESKTYPVPASLQGETLALDEAEPYMKTWCFCGGYGLPECHAAFIWTNQRVIWVSTYDGSSWLSSMPRHPVKGVPHMSGG